MVARGADTSGMSNSMNNSMWAPGVMITSGYFRKESEKTE